MDNIKPNNKFWAAQQRLTLEEGAQLINAREPNSQKNEIFEQARSRIESGQDISILKEFEKPCRDYAHLYRYFIDNPATVSIMAYGGGKFSPQEIINAALAMGLCDEDNEFVVAVNNQLECSNPSINPTGNEVEKKPSKRELNNNLKAWALVGILLARKSNLYTFGDNVSAKKIRESICEIAEDLEIDTDGLMNLDRDITEGLQLLEKKYAIDTQEAIKGTIKI